LCSCAQSFALQKKTSQSKADHIFSDGIFFKSGSKDKQPEQQISVFLAKDVPIVVHTRDWLKANLMDYLLKQT
jgi:hypothetical protein